MHLDCREASNPAKRVPKLSHHILSVFGVIEKWCIDKCTDVNTVLQFEWNGSHSDVNLQSVAFGDRRTVSGCCEAVVSKSGH